VSSPSMCCDRPSHCVNSSSSAASTSKASNSQRCAVANCVVHWIVGSTASNHRHPDLLLRAVGALLVAHPSRHSVWGSPHGQQHANVSNLTLARHRWKSAVLSRWQSPGSCAYELRPSARLLPLHHDM
ncbi:hypothetical protein LZ30DRAFT_610892, partial [Colletotrichum cereale]